MPDSIVIDCTTGEQTSVPLTAAQVAEKDAITAEDRTRTDIASQRQQRRAAAIAKLETIAAKPTPTVADTKFIAKVLAVALPFLDIDPG